MGLKIWVQESLHEDEMGADSDVLNDGAMRLLMKVKRPDTVLTRHFAEEVVDTPESLNFPWPLNWASCRALDRVRSAAACASTIPNMAMQASTSAQSAAIR